MKLIYDELLSNFAFNCSLRPPRPCNEAAARAFDDKMATALQAESHFCGHGGAGPHSRSCDIGFDGPKRTAADADCAAGIRAPRVIPAHSSPLFDCTSLSNCLGDETGGVSVTQRLQLNCFLWDE